MAARHARGQMQQLAAEEYVFRNCTPGFLPFLAVRHMAQRYSRSGKNFAVHRSLSVPQFIHGQREAHAANKASPNGPKANIQRRAGQEMQRRELVANFWLP